MAKPSKPYVDLDLGQVRSKVHKIRDLSREVGIDLARMSERTEELQAKLAEYKIKLEVEEQR